MKLGRSPRRWLLVSVSGAVCASTLVAGPAYAGAPKPPTDTDVVGTTWGDEKADKKSLDWYDKNDAKKDPGSLYTITDAIGARDVWKSKDAQGRPVTGQGVTVAVIDSGVAGVAGLDAPGKIVRGPDLSLENNSQTELGYDTFGHGTHMASIIAAKDAAAVDPRSGALKAGDASVQLGVAPDAQVLALKLASTDGSTDVSQVIAALDWVTEHKDDDGMNVRVVNLSFGTEALQPYEADPLAAAAENAWRKGLIVVVSGGNGGRDANGLTNPAIDPYVLAVGASDANLKVDGWTKHPRVADFSSRGTQERHVDLLAPGASVVGLRGPGSWVDLNHPEGRVAGDQSGRLFRGSGTSQAAAVVSGAVALMVQAYPELTPDQVKAALMQSATELKGNADPIDAGAGQIDVDDAVEVVKKAAGSKTPAATPLAARQSFPVATGTGSLELARGGANLVDPTTGALLVGEVDVQGQPWDATTWARESAAGTTWSGGTWNRARWSGDGWTSQGWSRARWSGETWSRARWSDVSWERARWSRARWSDASWERARWSGSAWS
ncbi:S8 family serine peptidase [uncultured Cellulomonas sp.]|uniref:S8 family serine peptidase n=1 Tax=uncultured Cellulomonas sp. TaxID=189682 RepID=UPI00260D9680|nr:S8 family serine peptidase [uncultured Cellulomonas sp.]